MNPLSPGGKTWTLCPDVLIEKRALDLYPDLCPHPEQCRLKAFCKIRGILVLGHIDLEGHHISNDGKSV